MWHRIHSLHDRPTLRKIIGNTGWLFFDRIIRMGVGLFVGVWIARFLGPDQYGLWNYALAFVGLFGAFAALGLDDIVVRQIVKEPQKLDIILGTAFALKLTGGLISFAIAVLAISFVRPSEPLAFWLVFLSAMGYIFQSFNVINFYFQARIESKFSVYAMNLAFVILTILKIVLLVAQAPLIAFAMAGLAEAILSMILLIAIYQLKHLSIQHWQFNRDLAEKLLKDSWPLILSGIAIMMYMRIDQIMIGQMLGDVQLGIFSAAVRVSEVWYFIPVAIVGSVFPILVTSKNKNEFVFNLRMQKLFDMMTLLGISVAFLVTFTSDQIVYFLFGDYYAHASTVLAIHTWAGVFVCLGVASSAWLTVEKLQKQNFYRTITGGIVNVALNFVFIPVWGIKGAAVATVISYGVSVFSVGVFTKSRIIVKMMLFSFVPFKRARSC